MRERVSRQAGHRMLGVVPLVAAIGVISPSVFAQQASPSGPAATVNDDNLGGLLGDAPAPAAAAAAANQPDAAGNPPAASSAAPSQGAAAASAAATDKDARPIPVQEQAPDPAGPHRPPSSALLEEIVVTAQKREEAVQNVPIAISAFNGEQLKELGVTSPENLTAVVPGLQANEAVGFSVTYLRGVGSDAFLMGDPSVALYIDDVYLPFANGANQKLGELERTEVLKGPQGTLFGRNAVGGAINIITKKPDFETPKASVDLEAGDYDHKAAKVYFNVPVLKNLALNFSALRDERSTYYRGAVDQVSSSNPQGTPIPGEKDTAVQARLRYAPLDWLEINANASSVIAEGPSGEFSPNDDPSPLALTLGIKPQKGFTNTAVNANPDLDLQNLTYSGNIKFHWDNWFDVKLLGSSQSIRTPGELDYDGSTTPIAAFHIQEFGKIYTGEVQILSNPTSWAADRWTWILGAYYFKSTQGLSPVNLWVASTDLNQDMLLGVQVPPLLINTLDKLHLGSFLPAGSITAAGILGTSSMSGYFQSTYHFTDWLATTLGGRYQVETRSIVQSTSNLQNIDGSKGPLLFESDSSQFPDLTTTRFSPKISLELRPFDNFLTYASYQTATKSGTYNVVNVVLQATKVRPEQLDAYEVGVKSDWLDGLLRVNGAVFLYKEKDQQVQFVSILAGGAIQLQNAPRGSVRGTDFDVVANLLPSYLDGLYLTASGAYLDAHYTSYNDCDGYDATTGFFSSTLNCNGNRIPRSPQLSGRLGLNKIFQFDRSRIEAAADVYYNSGYFTEASNVEAAHQNKYQVVNARLTYGYEPFNLNVTGYVRNITNQQYSLSKFDTDFGSLTYLAAPRTVGVQVSLFY